MTLKLPPVLVGVFDEVADLLLPPPEDTCTESEIRLAASELRTSGPVGRAAAKYPEFVRRYAAWTRAEGEHLERAIDELRGVRRALDEISAQVRASAAGRSTGAT